MVVFKITQQYISHCHFAEGNHNNTSNSKSIGLISPYASDSRCLLMAIIMRHKLKELGLFSFIHVIIYGCSRPVSIYQPCKCGFNQYFVLTRAIKI